MGNNSSKTDRASTAQTLTR